MAKDKTYDDGKSDYDKELENNTRVFKELVKKIRPDIYVLMDVLDETRVNPYILLKVIRSLNNIAIGNKYGQVHVIIENGVVTFVRGEEADKVGEPVLLPIKDKIYEALRQ